MAGCENCEIHRSNRFPRQLLAVGDMDPDDTMAQTGTTIGSLAGSKYQNRLSLNHVEAFVPQIIFQLQLPWVAPVGKGSCANYYADASPWKRN